ncbi:hypothetical protein D6D02_10493 [Aureobasidium pullulans]|nr:hypothetical protein D6D02_10493 [Aureobasidium pullulans]
MSAPIVALPPEIKRMILENLESDATDLFNMSLVHSGWRALATEEKWIIVGPLGFEHLMNPMEIHRADRQKFINHIQELEIYGHRSRQHETRHLNFRNLRSLAIRHPRRVPGYNLNVSPFFGPRLTELCIEGHTMPPLQVSVPDNYLLNLGQCPNLTRLELYRHIQDATPDQLMTALDTLTNLQYIGVSRGASNLVQANTVIRIARMPLIKGVVLDFEIDQNLAETIRDTVPYASNNLEKAVLTMTEEGARTLIQSQIMDTVEQFDLSVTTLVHGVLNHIRKLPNLKRLALETRIPPPDFALINYPMLGDLARMRHLTHLEMRARPLGYNVRRITLLAVEAFLVQLRRLKVIRLDWDNRNEGNQFSSVAMFDRVGRMCPDLKELSLRGRWAPFNLSFNGATMHLPLFELYHSGDDVIFPNLRKLSLSMLQVPFGFAPTPHTLSMNPSTDPMCRGAQGVHDLLRWHCPKLEKLVSHRMRGRDDEYFDNSVAALIAASKPPPPT